MESLPDNTFLKFNPDTLVAIRKLYNLDKPGQMDEAIDILDAWVKKQNHFVKKDFPRHYLERVIILLKGSVERAKAQLDKICTLRTLLPRYFENCNAITDYDPLKGFGHTTIIPKLAEDNTRILFYRYEPVKFTSKTFFYMYCYLVLQSEYLKATDYSCGINIVVDLCTVNITDLVAQLNLTELKQICTIFLEGFDTRALNFFFLSSSKTIDLLIKIFKQMISEKLGKRIHVFKGVEELQGHIAKGLLPSDYGGELAPLSQLHDEMMKELGSAQNVKYFKEMSKVQTIEALRPTASNYNDDFVGIAGTFRTLCVD